MVRAVIAHTVGAFAAFDKFVFVFDGIAVLATGRFVVLFGLLLSFDVVVVLVHVRFLLCGFLPDESRRARGAVRGVKPHGSPCPWYPPRGRGLG
ncbi:hypothetical protein [Bifidobacterium breve]|uniref:hypothetical protein n=1 Tax=Bifidobacterium breve TaxID=1685 RepID=UPI00165196AD|nr:hypothetical protein [Bifidobacterium breve]